MLTESKRGLTDSKVSVTSPTVSGTDLTVPGTTRRSDVQMPTSGFSDDARVYRPECRRCRAEHPVVVPLCQRNCPERRFCGTKGSVSVAFRANHGRFPVCQIRGYRF